MSTLSEVLKKKSSAELRDLLKTGKEQTALTIIRQTEPASAGGTLRQVFGDDELGQENAEYFRRIVGAWLRSDIVPRFLNVVHAIEGELNRSTVSKVDSVVRTFAQTWLRPRIHADYIAQHDGELRYAVSAVMDEYFPRTTNAATPDEKRTKLVAKLEQLAELL